MSAVMADEGVSECGIKIENEHIYALAGDSVVFERDLTTNPKAPISKQYGFGICHLGSFSDNAVDGWGYTDCFTRTATFLRNNFLRTGRCKRSKQTLSMKLENGWYNIYAGANKAAYARSESTPEWRHHNTYTLFRTMSLLVYDVTGLKEAGTFSEIASRDLSCIIDISKLEDRYVYNLYIGDDFFGVTPDFDDAKRSLQLLTAYQICK
jgi:hypothetical protein